MSHCGIGFYCEDTQYQHSERIEAISNNEAEFFALIRAMEWALDNGITEVDFFLDSQIVVNRANQKSYGRRKRSPQLCNNPDKVFKMGKKGERFNVMSEFQDQVFDLYQRFENCSFNWIPREQNRMADYLSKASLK